MKKSTISDINSKVAMLTKRYGADTGKNSGSKPAPKATVKPTGNPLKGKLGLIIKKKF